MYRATVGITDHGVATSEKFSTVAVVQLKTERTRMSAFCQCCRHNVAGTTRESGRPTPNEVYYSLTDHKYDKLKLCMSEIQIIQLGISAGVLWSTAIKQSKVYGYSSSQSADPNPKYSCCLS